MEIAFERAPGFCELALRSPLGAAALACHLHQMEVAGSQWIAVLPFECLSASIYTHLQEEMNHAQMLGRVARGLASRLDGQEAMKLHLWSERCALQTGRYLRNIAVPISKLTSGFVEVSERERWLSKYYALSFVLERRVMKIYPLVARAKAHADFAEVATRILREERAHLTGILAGAEPFVKSGGLDLTALGAMEDGYYESLESALKEAL